MNNQIEELKKEIEKLTIKLNNLVNENEKFKKFIPSVDENYWFVLSNQEVIERRYLFKDDERIVKNNFTFKTKEHAEEYREFMDMMKEKSRPFQPNQTNWSIVYNWNVKSLTFTLYSINQHSCLYFNEQVAEELIKNYPNELKHWYLEVPYED